MVGCIFDGFQCLCPDIIFAARFLGEKSLNFAASLAKMLDALTPCFCPVFDASPFMPVVLRGSNPVPVFLLIEKPISPP